MNASRFGNRSSEGDRDTDDNGVVNISDTGFLLPITFGQNYLGDFPDLTHLLARFDVNPDGVINIQDVGRLLPPLFGAGCSP